LQRLGTKALPSVRHEQCGEDRERGNLAAGRHFVCDGLRIGLAQQLVDRRVREIGVAQPVVTICEGMAQAQRQSAESFIVGNDSWIVHCLLINRE
jgi:hypothetical protein